MEGLNTDRTRAADVTGARVATEIAVLREQMQAIREASFLRIAEVERRTVAAGEKAQTSNDSLSALVDQRLGELVSSRALLYEGLLERIETLRHERALVTETLEKLLMSRMEEYRTTRDKEQIQVERANDKLETTINERFEAANNFRKQIESERIDYVRRDLLEQRSHATDTLIDLLRADMEKRFGLMREDIDKKLDPLITWRSTQTGRSEISGGIWAVAAAIFVSLVVVAVNLVLAT
jgi:hypothetical protein